MTMLSITLETAFDTQCIFVTSPVVTESSHTGSHL